MRHRFPILVVTLSALTFGGVYFAGGTATRSLPPRAVPAGAVADPANTAEAPRTDTAAVQPAPIASDGPTEPGTPTASARPTDCADNIVACYPPGDTSAIR